MKHSVVAAIFLLCIFSDHGMEKSSLAKRLRNKLTGSSRKKREASINNLLLYNVSDSILVVSNGSSEKIIHPKMSQIIDLPILHPLIVKTGDLSNEFSLDESMKGLQRFRIEATASEITIKPWVAET